MSKASKVYKKMWGDEKFEKLSKPQPNAQSLWTYILCGHHVTSLPGLWLVTPATMADTLGWSLNDTFRCFKEIVDLGMVQYDPKPGLLLVPKRLKHGECASPNVVKHWGVMFAGLPDSQLKVEFKAILQAWCDDAGKAFGKAFRKAFDCSDSGFGAGTNGRDQDQVQEQNLRSKARSRTERRADRVAGDGRDFNRVKDHCFRSWQKVYGADASWGTKDWAGFAKGYKLLATDEAVIASWDSFLESKDKFHKGHLPSKWASCGPATFRKARRAAGDF